MQRINNHKETDPIILSRIQPIHSGNSTEEVWKDSRRQRTRTAAAEQCLLDMPGMLSMPMEC